MSARQTWLWSAALALHLFLIIAASLQDISASLQTEPGILPAWSSSGLPRLEELASAALGQKLPGSNLLRQSLAAYTHCSGIEAGYSYFAPSVAASSKLEFELHYADGRIDSDVPPVAAAAAGYRISTLLDHLQSIHYQRLREALLKNLVLAVRQEHPGIKSIRARLSVADLPSLSAYREGKRISYQPLSTYDFRFVPRTAPPSAR